MPNLGCPGKLKKTMTVEFIYDLDCPNVAAARSHLLQAFALSEMKAIWTEWDRSSVDSPEHARQYGSPTILINGRDVVGDEPRESSTCCRLYRDAMGAMQGVPSVGVLAAALKSEGKNIPLSSPPKSGGSSGWKSSLATIPGIAFALLPKLACPACWPAYAGLLSSLGLGFLMEARYLFPMTATFLLFAVGALLFRASTRRGYGPFLAGTAAAAVVLIGKFHFDSDAAMFLGIGMLVAASFWNAWPRKQAEGCPTCIEDSPIALILEKEILL